MAREVITRIWCDPHMERGEFVEGEETPPITIGTLKPRVLALCEPCRKELLDPLRDVLADLGQKADSLAAARTGTARAAASAAIPGESYHCEYPGCNGYGPYQHVASLRSHVNSAHQTSWAEYQRVIRGEDDATLDLGEDEEYQIPEEFICGVDGCEKAYDPRVYERPAQAVGVHRASHKKRKR